MTIDIPNILNRNCLLRTLEIAFQSIKISKVSRGACHIAPPPAARVFDACVFRLWLNRRTLFLYSKGWTVCKGGVLIGQ